MKKRLVSLVLTLAIMLGVFPTQLSYASTTPFTDVKDTEWYADAVEYVYQNDLMVGTSHNKFTPNGTTTRGQIVTILYRIENSPPVSGTSKFVDVRSGSWYEDAIIWASEHDIVTGTSSSTFAPEQNISREQMATILYRYSAYKDYSLDNIASLDNYSDSSKVSGWAETAVKWAVGEGFISGVSSSSIAPAGTATRAQAATILMRFCSKQDKYIRFKEKDVDDFADCEVINLDDSDETNFAVLADESVVTETISSENQLIEIDEENGTYKFANINNDISSLKVGDILYHTYGDGDDDYLLLKVGAAARIKRAQKKKSKKEERVIK